MSNHFASELQSLERKVKILLAEHKSLKQEVAFLKSENDGLKATMQGKEDQLENFQNKIKISKLVNSISDDEDNTKELKQQIDQYIREIDKCITHLSQ